MRRVLAVSSVLITSTAAVAAEGKGIRFWNLTSSTITNLYLSPVSKNAWGVNQCQNDRDGTVDHDERLKITGIEPGRYDVKLANKDGRVCIVNNLDIKANAVFSIDDKDLTNCNR